MAIPRRVTTTDVARVAGVGKTTVSYVLNETPNQKIPKVTRQRVLDAAARLQYTPLSAARALRKGHNDMVLAILPDWPLARVVSSTLEHLSDELEQHGLSLIIRRAHEGPPAGTLWRELAPAAVIAFGDVKEAEQQAMRTAGIFVAAAFRTSASSTDAIPLSQEWIGALQAQHLAARDHRHLGIGAPLDDHLGVGSLRARGVRQACAQLGLDEPLLVTLEPSVEAAREAARRFAAAGVTAVAAFNDEIASALLAGMRDLGLRAPDDIAVIGVDNEPMSQFTSPPLSTISVDTSMMAEFMARAVVSGIDGSPAGEVDPSQAISLLIRGST